MMEIGIGYRFKTYKGGLCEVIGEENNKLLVRCSETNKVIEIGPLAIPIGLASGLFEHYGGEPHER